MARTFNGSSQYLSGSSTLLTNEPIDMVAYGNSTSNTAAQTAVGLGNNGASGFFGLAFRGDVASDPTEGFKQSDAAANGPARTSTGFTANTWAVASNSFISDTSRAAYINGGSKGTDATNVADPSPDFVSIGALVRSAVSQYFAGSIAEAYILNVNMSDAQHALAGAGISPLWFMPISNIRGWYPLQGDNNNRMANGYPNLSATGSPTSSVHPAKIIYPRINGLITC